MANIWFISDTHFFHANILNFINHDGERVRPEFASMEEMNTVIAERWNDRVKPQDKVYHLGDVTFRYTSAFNELMSRLNGHKRLLLGNHDRLEPALIQWFDRIELWRGFAEHNFTCTHLPIRLDTLRDGRFNVHGHIHRAHMSDPHYINVSVEVTGYAPVHLDEIVAEIRKRTHGSSSKTTGLHSLENRVRSNVA